MSIIVEDPLGKLLLLTKGADNVMFPRLSNQKSTHIVETAKYVNEYAEEGLRTLILA